MNSPVESNTANKLLGTFEQQLLRYRSLVYEQYMTPIVQHEQNLKQAKQNSPDILVIEDTSDEWFLIRLVLMRQFPTINIVWVSSALEVTTYFKWCMNEERELPYFILVDLYLPTVQIGLGILKSLKTHRLYHNIPLITVSRSNKGEDIADAFNCSTNRYIVKPNNYANWQEAFSPLSQYVPDHFVSNE